MMTSEDGMNKRELNNIKDILNEREHRAVTKLIEEVNDKSINEDSVISYIKEIKKTLNIISHRKNMLAYALNALEQYAKSGERGDSGFEESIKGSQLLNK